MKKTSQEQSNTPALNISLEKQRKQELCSREIVDILIKTNHAIHTKIEKLKPNISFGKITKPTWSVSNLIDKILKFRY